MHRSDSSGIGRKTRFLGQDPQGQSQHPWLPESVGKMGQWAPGVGRSTVPPDGFSGTAGGIDPTVQPESSSTAKLCELIHVYFFFFFWPCCLACRILVP